MAIVQALIPKASFTIVGSLLLVVLGTSVTSAESTYAQKIRIKGGLDPAGLIATADGGNALLFTDDSLPARKVLIRKVSKSGKKVWQRGLHPRTSQEDVGFVGSGVTELLDGSFIVSGNILFIVVGLTVDATPCLIRLTPTGEIDWQKSFPESGISTDFTSVVSSADGGFFAAGGHGPEFFDPPRDPGVIVARFDSSGNLRWGKLYSSFFVSSPSIFITSDEKLIVVSEIFPESGGKDTLILKLDASGNLIWKKLLRKVDTSFSSGAVTDDGGCILNLSSGSEGVFLVRMDRNGAVLWKKRFFAGDFALTDGVAVTQNADGNFAVTGTVYITGLKRRGFVARISSSGQLISGVTSNEAGADFPQFILPTSDSGIVLFGSAPRDLFLLKLDSNATLPGCALFDIATTMTYKSFGPLKISDPNVTITDWNPSQEIPDIDTRKLEVTSSRFCP